MEGHRFAAVLILTICMLALGAGAFRLHGSRAEECSRSEALAKCYYLPKDPGPCKARESRYYFNRYLNTCQEFIYGGCHGNANRFDTMEDCLGCCLLSVCRQPAEPGLCKAYMERYYFDMDSYDCKPFIYGGCNGNDNNFHTYIECYDRCGLE
uniref:Ctr_Kun_1 conopeptide n=1 Tax=Conus tribblei TaxID=101761 RepID=A0A0K8TU15_CONTD